jgi:hypothetical protein
MTTGWNMTRKQPNSPEDHPRTQHTQRDAETLILLGGFLIFLSVPVMIGSFWADDGVAVAVNLGAGLVLCGVGLGLFLRGRWYRRKLG